jgi:uncharacterized membrane protein (GlpM family)
MKKMSLSGIELFARFCAGGAVVLAVTFLAEQRLPLLSGIVNNFPALTMTSIVILLLATSSEVAVKLTKESLITLPVYIIFLLAFTLFGKFMDSKWLALAASVGVWCVAAVTFLYANQLVKLK